MRFSAGRDSEMALMMELWLSASLITAVLSVISGDSTPITVA